MDHPGMKGIRTSRKSITGNEKLLAVVVILLVGIAALTNYVMVEMPRRELVRGARVGMRRAEVVRCLGMPRHVARSLRDLQNTNSYDPVPSAPVEKEILEYYRGFSWRMYVYIDRSDHVSSVLLAKT
jgi:hypothetical protein